MKKYIMFAAVVLLCGGAAAVELDEFWDYLSNTDIFDSVDDIEYDTSTYVPDKELVCTGHICCWVDIVGYDGMVKSGDVYYINNSVEESVVVMYEISHDIDLSWNSGYSVDTFTAEITNVSVVNDTITVTLKVDLEYTYVYYVMRGDPPVPKRISEEYTETGFFTDVEVGVPAVYPVPGVYTAVVIYYNNTLKPKALCNVPASNLDTSVEYEYDGESVIYRRYNFVFGFTEKNFPYGNLTELNEWDRADDNERIFYFADTAWIPGSEFNVSNLSVFVHTPYVFEETELNVTVVDGYNTKVDISVMWPLVSCLMIIFLGSTIYRVLP